VIFVIPEFLLSLVSSFCFWVAASPRYGLLSFGRYFMLDHIFRPKSVAVIGASREKGKVGYNVLNNLVKHKSPGKIYPINPSAKTILGKKCFQSVLDVSGAIDMAVFAIPARLVVDAFDYCPALLRDILSGEDINRVF
jgi:hypothetical protein